MAEQLPDDKKKPSLFKKIINAIHSVWPKTDEVEGYRAISRFKLKAEDMINGPLPENIQHGAVLYEEALTIARRRIHTANKITELEEGMRDIEAYANLDENDAKVLKNLLDTFLSVTRDRNTLRYQLTDFDKGVDAIARLEGDAISAVPKIQDSERMHRILKRDIGYIEGEKADLEYERETLISGLAFIKKVSIGAIAALSIVTMYLIYLTTIRLETVFFPATALTLAAILIMCAIYMFRRRIIIEIKLNVKKQERAVELMNTKTAVLAYHTNFLNFAYKKYKVRNSQALIKNLSEYDRYKHVTSRLDSIRDIMYETERLIEHFLREKKIDSGKFSVEQFARNIDVEDKQKYYKMLEQDKLRCEDTLHKLDSRHGDVWEYLEELRMADTTGVLEELSKMYLDEVALLLGKPEEVDEEEITEAETTEAPETTDEQGEEA